jgi:hypothetical protein
MRSILMLTLVAACGGAPRPGPVPVADVDPAPIAVADPAPTAAVSADPAHGDGPAAKEVLRGRGDVDGRAGDENIVLYADGRLVAGGASGQAEYTDPSEYDLGKQAKISVVRLSAEVPRAVLLELPLADDEDPPNRYQLFAPEDGKLHRVLDVVLGVYGVTPVRFPGDGTMVYVEDGWTACTRDEAATMRPRADIHEVALGPHGPDGKPVEASRQATGQVQDCSQLAACPFVDLVGADGSTTELGEILRDLRGSDAYAQQTLALPSATNAVVHLRLREDKDEATYLDQLYLEVDGVAVAPRSCRTSGAASFCARDLQMTRMVKGDRLDLWFDLPSATPAGSLRLVASGYYAPTPTR